MPTTSNKPVAPVREETKSRAGRRLIGAIVLIGLAIGGLALVDRLRDRPAGLAPPHEPSQALMTTPEAEPAPTGNSAPAVTPPPPPEVVNNETLAPAPRSAATPAPSPLASEKSALAPGKAYMIQAGVFTSPANARALQKQLHRAGMDAHLETRVQLGPFKNKQEADKALARAKKLGISAVLVSAR